MTAARPAPPAPWTLTGEGFIVPVRGPRGLAVLMLVDYATSPVGPYHELLSIPARVSSAHGGLYPSIDRIVVDDPTSVAGGRANWGIPKRLAAFTWERDRRSTVVEVSEDGRPTARLRLTSAAISVPGPLSLLPGVGRRIHQTLDGRSYLTTLGGRGRLGRATLAEGWFDDEAWPALAGTKPLPGVHARSFTLTFGVPRVEVSAA